MPPLNPIRDVGNASGKRSWICLLWIMRLGFLASMALSLPSLRAEENAAKPPKFPDIQITIDGKRVAEAPNGLSVPVGTKNVAFIIGTLVWPKKDSEAVRFQFRMDGVEKEWQRRTSDMGIGVRFQDGAGDFLSQEYFYADSDSRGWAGTFEDSPLQRKRERVHVPDGAASVTLAISSAGAPDAIGAYAAGNLILYRKDSDGTIKPLIEAKFRKNPESGNLEADGWVADGTRASMAKIIELNSLAHSSGAFTIVDDNPLAHAEWRMEKNRAVPVQPGEELVLEWDEMFSIGLADQVVANYPQLPEGHYKFSVRVVNAMGVPGEERSISVKVYTPLWMQSWFRVFCGLVLAIPLAFGIRALVRVRVRQQLKRITQEHMVEKERLRIARDIHDDLGARLTHISLVSGSAGSEVLTVEEAKANFRKITNMTRDLVSALYETVWTVDPENDHLDALINYLSQMIENLCAPLSIRCRVKVPDLTENHSIASDVRHNVSLVAKEAVHNAIKHSGATEILIAFSIELPNLVISITDNGKGFDPDHIEMGNGLKNMQRRMQAVRGSVAIDSKTKQGTTIVMKVPIV